MNFFASLRQLRHAAQRNRTERPGWVERSLAITRRNCEQGLRIYETDGAPLCRQFPWNEPLPVRLDDALYAIRPHRFAFAPQLALSILYGAPFAKRFADVLEGWMTAASKGEGPYLYASNLVVIQRFLALSWAWSFLAARLEVEADGNTLELMILKILHADAQYLATRLGDSYPNNHLLADAFAGWYIGLLFPEFLSDSDWRTRFEAMWLGELARQTYEDGSSFEHSTHYHESACELAVAYVLLSRANAGEVPGWVMQRTRRMLQFQLDIVAGTNAPLRIGDAIEDGFFPLDTVDGWGTAVWGEVYRQMFAGEA